MPAPHTNVLSTTIFRSHNYDLVYQSFQILVSIVSFKSWFLKLISIFHQQKSIDILYVICELHVIYMYIQKIHLILLFCWKLYQVKFFLIFFFVGKKLNMRQYRWICILVAICCIWFTMLHVHLMQKHSLPVQFKIKICTNSLPLLKPLHLASCYMSVQSIENSFKMLRLKEQMTRKITLTWKISFWRLFVVL